MLLMKVIALDADGVLLDYHAAYRMVWEKAFGYLPALRDPLAYWPLDRWDVRRLQDDELQRFRACLDEDYWSSLPAIQGAVSACERLCEAGYELVCISAIKPEFQAARLRNLRHRGFPIGNVISAHPSLAAGDSPKVAALREVNPVAFVDDYLPYFRGIPSGIHAALVLRQPHGSPNVGAEVTVLTHSQHDDLAAFVSWWLDGGRDRRGL